MGLIFRKSVKVMPGVKLNFSKNGMSSISFGGKGGRVTFGKKRATTTIGIPGTGLRYQTTKSRKSTRSTPPAYYGNTPQGGAASQWGCAFLLIGIFLFLGFLLIGQKTGLAFGSLGFFAFLSFLSAVANNSSSSKPHVAENPTTTNTNTVSYNAHVDHAISQSQTNELYNRISDDTKYYFSKLDPLLIDAIVAFFINDSTISTSYLQRKLSISFAYATRLMEWIERIGIISPRADNGNRTLLVSSEDLPIALDSIDLSKLIKDNDDRLNAKVEAYAKQATLEFELPRRKQIYEESVKLMQTTQVFNTLSRRYEDVINFINWACDMKESGCSCNINMTRENAITEANECFNEGAYRVCKAIIGAADTPRKKLNATAKVQSIEQSLKDALNKDQIKVDINTLIGGSNETPTQSTHHISVASSPDEPINIFWNK